jgi:hypothetical protein
MIRPAAAIVRSPEYQRAIANDKRRELGRMTGCVCSAAVISLGAALRPMRRPLGLLLLAEQRNPRRWFARRCALARTCSACSNPYPVRLAHQRPGRGGGVSEMAASRRLRRQHRRRKHGTDPLRSGRGGHQVSPLSKVHLDGVDAVGGQAVF